MASLSLAAGRDQNCIAILFALLKNKQVSKDAQRRRF
jgi:hypothetical protein